MGDVAVRVCLGDYVVSDRVLHFKGITTVGDCMDSDVAFPGAMIPIVRVGEVYQLRGRSLHEGEELRFSVGSVDVRICHIPRVKGPVRFRSFVDMRFVAAAVVLVVAGAWIDSAEAWIYAQPMDEAAEVGTTLKRLAIRARHPALVGEAAAVRGVSGGAPAPAAVQQITDGPRHLPNDADSGTAFYRWYRASIPDDPLADGARLRLADDDTDASARLILANATYNADRYDEAAWHYQEVAWQDDADAGALIGLARAHRRMGRHAHEIDHYRRVLASWNDHTEALAGLSTALARMGRLDEASITLEQLWVVAPDDPYTEIASATIAGLVGREDDAIEHLERAVEARAQLSPSMQIELRRDLALDPAFASLRMDHRLRNLLRRQLGAAGPRPLR